MNQLELEFFWPLTEQIRLDLDFTPCEEYAAEKQRQRYANSISISTSGNIGIWNGITTTSNDISLKNLTEFRPSSKSVGYWKVSPEVHYYVTHEPNWFIKKMTKLMLGWEWGK